MLFELEHSVKVKQRYQGHDDLNVILFSEEKLSIITELYIHTQAAQASL